jgi:glycosyltransferase involved in cell wall biosynthesis
MLMRKVSISDKSSLPIQEGNISMAFKQRILVIIPAFNEEESVGKVINEVRANLPQVDILVVNDASSDLTSEIAQSQGVIVLDLPFNLGIGGTMQAGYKYAYEKGYDIAIQVDGDGQHDPKEIPKLLQGLQKKQGDMIVGSRFIANSKYKASIMRRLGSSILAGVISMVIKQKITDPTSGFRAADRKAIQLFASYYPQDYPEPEVLVLLSKSGLKISEVPVKMKQRYSGESSITKIRAIYYMVKVLLAIFVDCFKSNPL